MMKLISDKSQELIKGDNCFDIIRYYLSFIVVFAHFSILSGANNFNWITSSGEAVSGFFILSGFLVYYSFLKKPQLNDYIKKRARRILPPYIFIVFLCFIGGLFLSTMTVSEDVYKRQGKGYDRKFVCALQQIPCRRRGAAVERQDCWRLQPRERRFPFGHVRRAHHRILRAFKISGSQV